jgi:hypothetical protein
MNLSSIQSFFAIAIQSRSHVAESADPRVTNAEIAGNARLSPEAQLEIYREQFWLRHVNVLVEDFMTLEHLLGHQGFETLCQEYLAALPPTDFSLRDLGARLPSFMAGQSPYKADALLLDCARVEWAFVEAFDAKDAPPLEVAMLAAVPEDAWPSIQLSLHPSVQPVALEYPAHELRARVRDGEHVARPNPQPCWVVVYRGPEALQYISIEPLAFALLRRLASGASLGSACEDLASSEEVAHELEEKIGGWFQSWAAMGWISSIAR